MEIYILILLAVLVVLMIAAIALILSNKPKKDNSIALLDQKADINAKRTHLHLAKALINILQLLGNRFK